MVHADVSRANKQMVGCSGTLIVTVPYGDGLVVASDTRSTTLGVRCDGNSKVRLLNKPEPSLLAATGTSTWISAKFPLWEHDPCGDLKKNGITFFDAKEIAAKYVEQYPAPISSIDLKGLGSHLIEKVLEVHSTDPGYVKSFAGKTMFQVVLSSFDLSTKTVFIRAVQLKLTDEFQIKVDLSWDSKFDPTSPADYPHFGDTIAVAEHVRAGSGKVFLSKKIALFDGKNTVKDISFSDAEAVAINLIEAAKRTSESTPILLSIGGEIEVYRLSEAGAEKLR